MNESDSNIESRVDQLLSVLTEEFLRSYREGSHPSVEEYAQKHPEVAERIREILSAAVAMERLGGAEPWNLPHSLEGAGATIGRYKLLQRIGEGGFGVVYMAEQTEPVRRKVAFKIIKPGLDTRQVIARFEAERQALALMDHDHIAKVLDAGATDSGRPYFVMELVHGAPITEFCDACELAPSHRLELFVKVCRAVQHAHTKGIIHRDIKPSNVLVTLQEGVPTPKVIDFGVAKAVGQQLTDKTLFTYFAQMVGTPLYMSPEQAELTNADVDTRSDVYSLGVLLYELLTGTTPLDEARVKQSSFDEVRRLIREEDPPRPSVRLSTGGGSRRIVKRRQSDTVRAGLPFRCDLDWIVMKALAKERSRRYETANAFARDVENYLRGEEVEARPPSTRYRVDTFVRRNKGPVTAAMLVLSTLVIGVIGTTWQTFRANEARRAEAHRAQGERLAKEVSQRRLAQIENVTTILASVLRDLNPVEAEKAGVTSRDLLSRRLIDAAERLDGEVLGESLSIAHLQRLMGTLLRQFGRLEEASSVLAKASHTFEKILGADHLDSIAVKHELAIVAERQRNYQLAGELFQCVLAARIAALGTEHHDTLATKHQMAWMFCHEENYEAAELLCKDLLATREKTQGSDDLDTLASRYLLGVIYWRQGKLGPAESLLQSVLASRSAKLGGDHPDASWCRYYLGILNRSQGKSIAAQALLERVVTDRTAKLGPDDVDTIRSKYELASVYVERGLSEKAVQLCLEIVAAGAVDHPVEIVNRDGLAALFQSLGLPDQSIPLLEESLAVRRATPGVEESEILGRQVTLGSRYCDVGRFSEGLALIEEVRRMGRFEPHPAWVYGELLAGYQKARMTKEAVELVKERVQELRAYFPSASDTLVVALCANAEILLELKAYDLAEQLLVESFGPLNPSEDDHAETVDFELSKYNGELLIQLYDAWGKPEQADAVRKALDRRASFATSKPLSNS